eukprot:TRINITY_DN27959_c0_g1_i1.p1 TRINITY_DN27959_c0_g1~~TRINITY_DN27959_c0_g1_i1.p1  ORF type:complete len:196 (-),score=54.86 TRINITY_DN27959_c0_g1_i1:53-604(-)
MAKNEDTIKALVRNVPDFPEPGIQFKDISTLLCDPKGIKAFVDALLDHYKDEKFDYVAGMEARGFIVGMPVSDRLNKGFIMLRKPNKLPGEKIVYEYYKEYNQKAGPERLEISAGLFPKGSRVLIVDDLLATGGTAVAAIKLIEKAGGVVAGCGFIIELDGLGGGKKIREAGVDNIYSIVSYT